MIRILGTIFAGLLGLAFGSFLNVCLSRWPEGESVVKPRSHCRNCDHTLSWWENVPLVSWLALRGRCRRCGAWIGLRYPLVELAVAAIWTVPAWRLMTSVLNPTLPPALIYLETARTACVLAFFWFLVALAILDAEHLWLPDWITLPGIALGFMFDLSIVALPSIDGLDGVAVGLLPVALLSLLAIAAAAGLMLFIRFIYWLIRRREGLGLGDVKLMAMLTAWLGLRSALLAFILGIVLGASVALVLLAIPSARAGSERWSASKLPLGTFLCIGGVVSALWGQPIIATYLRWAGF